MKDLFSAQTDAYKKYRPLYPMALYEYIISFVEKREIALDVATGNGQAAVALAHYFEKVIGSDISAAQLANAEQKENVNYLRCAAEQTSFAPGTFDLITVAQAYHWLQHEAFATEAARIAKHGAVMAAWLYDRFTTSNQALNNLMDEFYFNIVGPYWDGARKHVDAHYDDLPFPYEPLPSRQFSIETIWNKEQLTGYLLSWSSVQEYIQVHQASPLPLIEAPLAHIMRDESITALFPVYLRLGRIHAG